MSFQVCAKDCRGSNSAASNSLRVCGQSVSELLGAESGQALKPNCFFTCPSSTLGMRRRIAGVMQNLSRIRRTTEAGQSGTKSNLKLRISCQNGGHATH